MDIAGDAGTGLAVDPMVIVVWGVSGTSVSAPLDDDDEVEAETVAEAYWVGVTRARSAFEHNTINATRIVLLTSRRIR